MSTVVLVIHLLLALAIIGVVLMQRSEGGGLGIGGGGAGGGGMGGLMTGRGTANLLSRTTAILAACFMVTSMVLAILAGPGDEQRSILETLEEEIPGLDQGTGAPTDQPSAPDQPSVPVE